ncbi:MAG TPA: hypothetical protein VGM96_21370 [Reyranella sp.]
MTQGEVASAIVKVSDRRLDVRYVGPVNGCYTLSSHKSPDGGGPEVYACRTQSLSPSAIAVLAPVMGEVGEWLTARLDVVGILRGRIIRLNRDGFVFDVAADDAAQRRLAARIEWLKRRSVRLETDKREAKRFQPRDPRSTLVVARGSLERCFVIDLSATGAAISSKQHPAVGAAIVVGRLASHVVRHLDVGFAVSFDAQQDVADVEGLATGFEPAAAASGSGIRAAS